MENFISVSNKVSVGIYNSNLNVYVLYSPTCKEYYWSLWRGQVWVCPAAAVVRWSFFRIFTRNCTLDTQIHTAFKLTCLCYEFFMPSLFRYLNFPLTKWEGQVMSSEWPQEPKQTNRRTHLLQHMAQLAYHNMLQAAKAIYGSSSCSCRRLTPAGFPPHVSNTSIHTEWTVEV